MNLPRPQATLVLVRLEGKCCWRCYGKRVICGSVSDGAAKGLRDPDVGVEVEGEPGLPFGRVGVTGLLAGATGAESGGCGLRSVPRGDDQA